VHHHNQMMILIWNVHHLMKRSVEANNKLILMFCQMLSEIFVFVISKSSTFFFRI
jgi:hypothetical protein